MVAPFDERIYCVSHMLWTNLKIAAVLFFGWFVADSIASILGSPLEGIYYPMASGTLKSVPGDWTNKPWFGAPLYLTVFSSIWLFLIRNEGVYKGSRVTALFTSFSMAPFWIVSAISADMYDLDINGFWLATMIYSNVSFVVFGFLGRGNPEDIYF